MVAVKIRMKKLGRRNRPFFRVCAIDGRSPRNGRVIEELGTYDPMVPETDARAILKGDRIEYWLSVGAQPSERVSVLIKKYGKDGSHLDAQQQALDRLATRRSDAIASATSSAAQSAQRHKAQREAEAQKAADAKAKAEAEAAAKAAQAAESTEASDQPSGETEDVAAAEAADQPGDAGDQPAATADDEKSE